MKKLFIYIVATAVFIGIVSYLTPLQKNDFLNKPTPKNSKNAVVEFKNGNVSVKAKLADTNEKRKNGLSKKSELEEGRGVLFSFDKKDTIPSFWMKDMNFSIDIIWIDDEKVAYIHHKLPVPKPGTSISELKTYKPPKKIDYVLEVNAGFAEKNKIKVGDLVTFLFN